MQKELSVFDYLPKVLPVMDLLFIIWVALNSPEPWITTPIHIGMPVIGFTSLMVFRKNTKAGFYFIGLLTSLPVFFLNCWGNADCPTWLAEFSLIAGGLLMTTNLLQRLVVLGFMLATTVLPLYMNDNSWRFIGTIVIGGLALWFLLERSVKFMEMQKARIEEQKRLVEEKQTEILSSIRYAKRIQQSLLPTEKYIDKSLKRLKKKTD